SPALPRCLLTLPTLYHQFPYTTLFRSKQWQSDQYPLRPERILSELRQAVPEDGFIVTDVGWNKNGVAQQFSITVPGTFITPSGLDRKSTRLNSSHEWTSYAVFCLKEIM